MKIAVLLLASVGITPIAHAAEPLVLTTESYPPFSYQDSSGAYRGVGIDQVEIIMRDLGIPRTIEIMPWARAIALAETQEGHCVFAAARTAEREARFKWVVPLFVDRSLLVRHTGSTVKAATIEEAKQYMVGTYRADYTEGLLRSAGFPKIDLSADLDITLRKLLRDRIDLMPISEGVYQKLKAEGTAIEKVMVFAEQQLGIACNRQVPDALIGKMQTALDTLIKDGVQSTILKRYGINVPQ